MAIEAVKIPQNIYVEDRIIGPVTLKQLIITGLGMGISYVLYAMVTKSGVTNIPVLVMCWIPGFIAACFAFLKINDLSLFNIILLMIEGMNKNNVRYWSPHPGLSINLITRQWEKEWSNANAKAAVNAARLAEVTLQMQKRQEEMNRFASHQEQRPETLEALTPTLTPTPTPTPDQGLDPALSIDNITQDLKAYEHLIAQSPPQ